MNPLKSVLRAGLRTYLALAVRGRYRAANLLVKYLAPDGSSVLQVGPIALPLDLDIATYRYIWAGLYEQANVRHWRNVLRPGDTFLDGGANVGYTAAIAAECVGQRGHVYAVEPSPTCVAKLQSYLRADNITLLPAALSDREGMDVFCDTPRVISQGYAALAQIESPPDATKIDVSTVTVDALMEQHKIARLRYLKLDLEGAELLALRGAARSLREGRIDYVMAETTYTSYLTAIANAIADLMLARGYRPHAVADSGQLKPFDVANAREGDRLDVVWIRPGL